MGRSFYEQIGVILAEVEEAKAFAAETRAIARGQIRVDAPGDLRRRTGSRADRVYQVDDAVRQGELNVNLRIDRNRRRLQRHLMRRSFANSGLIARPLRPMEFVLCGVPAYIDAHGTPARPMHILYAPDRRITPKLPSFVDFAIAQFAGLSDGA